MPILVRLLATGLLAALLTQTAFAQTKPHSSGHLSFNAPQMRRHGSGFHRPNRPHTSHHTHSSTR